MENNLYCFLKDIGIPGLNLVATITIGIFIALYLNRKTSKEKIKNVLIDSYIEYLLKFKNFIEIEHYNLMSRVYRVLSKTIEEDNSFHSDSKKTLIERFNIIIKGLDKKYSPQVFDEKASFFHFTHKFAFLIGKKRYIKFLQPYESKLSEIYLLNPDIKKNHIIEVLNSESLKECLSNLKKQFTEDSFNNLCNSIISKIHYVSDRDKFIHFHRYNEKLSDEIFKY